MTRILPYVLAGTVVAAGLVWAFLPRAVTVETALVAPRDLTVGIEAEGTARIREVFTVSAPIGGQLDRVALHPGDAVAVGDAGVIALRPTTAIPMPRMSPAAAASPGARKRRAGLGFGSGEGAGRLQPPRAFRTPFSSEYSARHGTH